MVGYFLSYALKYFELMSSGLIVTWFNRSTKNNEKKKILPEFLFFSDNFES